MTVLPRLVLLLLLIGLAALVVFPFFAERFYLQLVTKIMVTAILAISLDLLVGYAGMVSFGHAAFFGLAGYALAVLQRDFGLVLLWTTLPAVLAVCGVAALIVGWFSIRTSGIYFIMITLAFAQMLYYYFNDSRAFGGSDGMFIDTKPTIEIFGFELVSLRNRIAFYYVTLGALVASYLIVRMILLSPFGRVIAAIRINEPRARALGYATRNYKLACFVIAGMLAGLAGYLGAAQYGVINPAFLSWHQSGQALVVVILGGMGTLFGPVLGAFVLTLLEEFVSGLTERWLVVIGAFVIAVVLLLPGGIASLLVRLRFGRRMQPAP
ncbi:MAG: branched-chain amino acid ABC transporter permease [Proteobacteria bacterium]|nr:branched-chain amino acid ABC transporter permease [Pseudomonadota bacterium]